MLFNFNWFRKSCSFWKFKLWLKKFNLFLKFCVFDCFHRYPRWDEKIHYQTSYLRFIDFDLFIILVHIKFVILFRKCLNIRVVPCRWELSNSQRLQKILLSSLSSKNFHTSLVLFFCFMWMWNGSLRQKKEILDPHAILQLHQKLFFKKSNKKNKSKKRISMFIFSSLIIIAINQENNSYILVWKLLINDFLLLYHFNETKSFPSNFTIQADIHLFGNRLQNIFTVNDRIFFIFFFTFSLLLHLTAFTLFTKIFTSEL